ncbi:hypothetical protein C4577_02145 [Candidatus Parcubacteria bacterium]|nr:MAG: hypothetical protein C4577_02145 [Candidatus Parcubacteria bacterium]
MKQRRFFYHFRKNTKGMTVHFKGKCIACWDVKCLVPCETKRNKRQPFLVMQGFADSVEIQNDIAVIR